MKKIFISCSMGLDEKLLALSDEDCGAAMWWPWLLCALDDWGRASANPRTLKAQVVPAFASITADHVACWVKLYEKHGLVTVYGTVDRQVLCVDQEAWYRYQTQIPRDRREKQASRFPAPPDCASSSETALVLSRTSEQVLPPSSSPFPSPLVPPPTPPPYNPPVLSPNFSPSLPAPAQKIDAENDIVSVAPAKVSRHPNFPYLEVFAEVMGTKSTRTETRDRSLVANELREAGYTPDQCRQALVNWPDRWPTIHRTVRGLLRNMTALLAPQPVLSTRGKGSAVSASQTWLKAMETVDGQVLLLGGNEPVVGQLPVTSVQRG